MALAMLAEGFGVKLDNMTPARVRILDQALAKIPPPLLEPMVQRAIATRKPRWGDLPAVAELREDAEHCRLEMVKALGEYGCAECSDSRGWIAVTHPDGVRMERCRCWKRHQQKLAQLGVGHEPLALPPAETRDWTQAGEVA